MVWIGNIMQELEIDPNLNLGRGQLLLLLMQSMHPDRDRDRDQDLVAVAVGVCMHCNYYNECIQTVTATATESGRALLKPNK